MSSMPNSNAAPIVGLVLAAGNSSRLGQAKQLVSFQDTPLVNVAVAKLNGLVGKTFVVTGARRSAVAPLVTAAGAYEIYNPNWRQGMGSSLACAFSALPQTLAAVLVIACDQYRVTRDELTVLLNAFRHHPDKIIAARYESTYGIPCIFPHTEFPALANLSGERGAKSILQENTTRCLTVPLKNAQFDLDWPWQLDLLKRYEHERNKAQEIH